MIRFASAAVALIALAAVSGTAQAAASGTVQLRGTVAVDCSVSVTDLNQSLALRAGETAKTVGQVVETCNAGTGYTISLSSANAGKLRTDAGQEISYSVGYDGQAGGLGSNLTVNRATAQFGKQVNLSVTVPASETYIAGNYADTVTVTIAAK